MGNSENVETHNISINNLIFYKGYLCGNYENKIKVLKYLPYFEDYHNAILTVFKIMNSRDFLFRKELYVGKLYTREIKLLMDMHNKYTNTNNNNNSNNNNSNT